MSQRATVLARGAATTFVVIAATMFIVFGAARCEAQISTAARINGTVTDASGSIVPQADIRIRNEATGVEIATQSNSDGTFLVPSVPEGTYSLTASKPGFETYVESGIILHPAMVATVNPAMKVGQVSTKVEVVATATTVQTSTPEVSAQVFGQQVETLPLNGRNFQALAALMPGAVNTNAGIALQSGGRNLRPVMQINGLDPSRVYFYVDGISDSEPNQNTINPDPDQIEEVRTFQDNYDVRYNFQGTSVVMVQTKSGTSSFHGSAFEYLRNNDLNARNPFSSTVSPYKQNIFGYTVGGPIYIPGHYNTTKSKTFFFWSQQWVDSHQGQTGLGATPPAAMRQGDFSSVCTSGFNSSGLCNTASQQLKNPVTGLPYPNNNITSTSTLNSNSLAFLNTLYPLPNNPGGGFNNYINNNPQISVERDDEIKVDHNFTPKLRLTGEYLDEQQTLQTPNLAASSSVFPVNSETDYTNNNMAQLELVWTLSNSVVNTAAISMNNFVLYLNVEGLQFVNQIPGFQEQLPFNGFLSNRIPAVTFSGGWQAQGINGGRPIHASDLRDVFHDDISWQKGKHEIEAGTILFYLTKRQGNNNGGFSVGSNGAWSFNGTYSGHPIADFLLGDAATFGQSSSVVRGYMHDRFNSFYVSDHWKATPRLTLTAGVRVSFLPLPHSQQGFSSVFEPALYNPANAPVVNNNGTITPGPTYDPLNGLVRNGLNGVPLNFFTGHQWSLVPTVGFAWDVFGDGKTSLRGGYGVTNLNKFTIADCSFTCTSNPPLINSTSLINVSFPSPGGTGTAAALGARSLYSEDPNFRPYQTQTYSLSVQHEFAGRWLASVAGAGTIARHLDNTENINLPPADPPYDFNPIINGGTVYTYIYGPYQGYGSITMYSTAAKLYWNALELSLTHPVGHGVFLSAAYTWSHDLGNDGGSTVVYRPNAFYGNNGSNVPQVFNTSVIWSLPWYSDAKGIRGLLGGWKFSDITTVETGSSLTAGLSIAHQGLAVRPNAIGSISGPKTVGQWFNTAAFTAPAAGYFGNAGTGTILGPGLINFDMSLYKDFRITERQKIEFRAELFNTFNHTNFNGVSTAYLVGNFGQLTSARDPRIAEFALRYQF